VSIAEAFERRDGTSFNRLDFQLHPELYQSVFPQRVVPYVNAILNCAYWDARFPRLLTKHQLKRLYERDDMKTPLFLVTDISCDINGSIEVNISQFMDLSPPNFGSAHNSPFFPLGVFISQFLERASTIESPFYQYDPAMGREIATGVGSEGITVMGVDILPTELPKDSSEHFGHIVASSIVPELLAALSPTGLGVDPSRLSSRLVGDSRLLHVSYRFSRTATSVSSLGFSHLPKLAGRLTLA
jgi:alpha-aminoadipic semialdehyde synthase